MVKLEKRITSGIVTEFYQYRASTRPKKKRQKPKNQKHDG